MRIFSFENCTVDSGFWEKKIISAYTFRKDLGLAGNPLTFVYRLVNAEGDGMPGVIMDQYNDVVVIQCHTLGMHKNRMLFTEILKGLYGKKLLAIYDKSKGSIPFRQGEALNDEYLFNSAPPQVVIEKGLKFMINHEEGQKTGFFIDQRENRVLLKKYAAGRKVLNMFCYTGGFSVYALSGVARLVPSVDSSAPAINATIENILLNFGKTTQHEAFTRDAIHFLSHMQNRYDLIILDPPAFAKHQNALANALKGYKRLNQIVLEKIEPGESCLLSPVHRLLPGRTFGSRYLRLLQTPNEKLL